MYAIKWSRLPLTVIQYYCGFSRREEEERLKKVEEERRLREEEEQKKAQEQEEIKAQEEKLKQDQELQKFVVVIRMRVPAYVYLPDQDNYIP